MIVTDDARVMNDGRLDVKNDEISDRMDYGDSRREWLKPYSECYLSKGCCGQRLY